MVALAGVMIAVLFSGFGIGTVELTILAALWVGWFIAVFKWAIPSDRRDRQRVDS